MLWDLKVSEILFQVIATKYFKADRLQMIVVAKKYTCVATVHQYDA